MAGKKGGLGRGLESLFQDSLYTEPASVLEDSPSRGASKNKATSKKEEGSNTLKRTGGQSTKNAALHVEKPSVATEDAIVYINLNDIKPNASQPRKDFRQEALEELAESIREHGVIQPVLLRPSKKGYEIVAGERRWRAARLAGLKSVPAIVRKLTDRQNAFYALIENMQREDLNPIEEAEGILEIIGNYGLTQEEAAAVVGKSRPYVSNALRIARLPQEVRELVEQGRLSAGHARAIAGLGTEALQIEAAKRAAAEGWSVRQIENYTGVQTKRRKKASRSKAKSADVRAVEASLTESLGTRVYINGSEKRGSIQIEYYSREELDRLIEQLTE